MADSSKTEKATPKKRSDARKTGNIFFSNDAVSVAVLLASFAAIRLTGPNIVKQLESFFRYCMSRIASVESEELMGMLPELVAQFLLTCVKTAGPIFAVAALVGVAITVARIARYPHDHHRKDGSQPPEIEHTQESKPEEPSGDPPKEA